VCCPFIKQSHITTPPSRTSSFATILESTAVGESPTVNQRLWTTVGRRPTCSAVNPVDQFRWNGVFTCFTLVDSTALINLGDPCKRALTSYCSDIASVGFSNKCVIVLETNVCFCLFVWLVLLYCSDSKCPLISWSRSERIRSVSHAGWAYLTVPAVPPFYRTGNDSFLCLHLSLPDLYFSMWISANCWFVQTWLPATMTASWKITGLLAVQTSHCMRDYSTVNVYTVLSYLIYEICLFVCEICCSQKMSARMHCKCMDDVNCAFVYCVMIWTRVSKQVCSYYSRVTEDSSLLGCYAVL
jgi:hypothetical protein